jgi:hypothetical protein
MKNDTTMSKFVLPGFQGGNPLGFLAALGLLRILTDDHSVWRPRLNWAQHGTWRPALHLSVAIKNDGLVDAVFSSLSRRKTLYSSLARRVEPNVKLSRTKFRNLFSSITDWATLSFLAASGAELPEDDKQIAVTPLRMVNGSGHQDYLPIIREIAKNTGKTHVAATLMEPWRFTDAGRNRSLRWDPSDKREYALRWDDPSTDPARVQLAANRLAIEAIPLFPIHPRATRAATVGFHLVKQGRRTTTRFRWPIWQVNGGASTQGLTLDAIRSLLELPQLASPSDHRAELRQLGVQCVYESERLQDGYYGNFAPSSAIPI